MPPLSLYSTQPRCMEGSKGAQGLAQVSIRQRKLGGRNRKRAHSPKNFQLSYVNLTLHLKMNVFLRRTRAQQQYKVAFNLHSLQRHGLNPGFLQGLKDPLKECLTPFKKCLLRACSYLQVRHSLWSLVKTITTFLMKNHPQFHKKCEPYRSIETQA